MMHVVFTEGGKISHNIFDILIPQSVKDFLYRSCLA